MIQFPNIDPVLFRLGFIEIRWYGLSYLIGTLMGFYVLRKAFYRAGLSVDQTLNLMSYMMMGVILGGRIGYALFYQFSYYSQTPLAIFKVWEGGMSYHGGALGAMLVFIIYAKVLKKNPLQLLDLLGLGSVFSLFFGRIANFINGELYGRVSDVPWAMVFPTGGPLPRHPSQLYEAGMEGLLLGLILAAFFKWGRLKPGQLFGLYLIFYGVFRFIIEFFREPDAHLGVFFNLVTMGQLLCGVMVLCGALFFYYSQKIKYTQKP